MASKLKIAVITLSTAFAAVAIPSAGFMVEAGLEARKISADLQVDTAQVLSELDGKASQEDVAALTNEYRACVHEQAIPALAIATTLDKWGDRVSVASSLSNALKGVAEQEALFGIEETMMCVQRSLQLIPLLKEQKKPVLTV